MSTNVSNYKGLQLVVLRGTRYVLLVSDGQVRGLALDSNTGQWQGIQRQDISFGSTAMAAGAQVIALQPSAYPWTVGSVWMQQCLPLAGKDLGTQLVTQVHIYRLTRPQDSQWGFHHCLLICALRHRGTQCILSRFRESNCHWRSNCYRFPRCLWGAISY